MLTQPPNWRDYFSADLLKKALSSAELEELKKKAAKEYVYWDKFKHYSIPPGFTTEEAWAYVKLSRLSNGEQTPIRSKSQEFFSFSLSRILYQRLSFIDSQTSGFLKSKWEKPDEAQKTQLIISGLSEEAIASSQIEGANTSRKVAKEMILSERKPRTRDEQMIVNNYQVMQRLLDWKDLDLSTDMLLEIQKNITVQTLDDEDASGRFRRDEDGIGVVDRLTGNTVFVPPSEDIVQHELKRLIRYANEEEKDEDFVHPVVKASILHFWLAYLHPFVDGNGRTARALFYWYLLKRGYWMFQYLSVSRAIKESKNEYDNAFLYSEYDDNDLTYFLVYKTRVVMIAIEKFIEHYERKLKKEKELEKIANLLKGFNERQVALLQYFDEHKGKTADIRIHQNKHGVAYQTARTDLLELVEKGFLTQLKRRNKYEFIPNTVAIKKLFKNKLN